jgi:hypothetical protein
MKWLFLLLIILCAAAWFGYQHQEQQARECIEKKEAKARVDMRAEFSRIAYEARVELRAMDELPDGAIVTLAWFSDNSVQGADFLQYAQSEGLIRDFDINLQIQQIQENHKRGWQVRCRLKY